MLSPSSCKTSEVREFYIKYSSVVPSTQYSVTEVDVLLVYLCFY
jgi:hypothetical protein